MGVMNYSSNRRFSDRFILEIRHIVGGWLLCEAPVTEDIQRNTDLIVLKMEAKRVACRVRRHRHLTAFGDQFTLRTKSRGGVSELEKVAKGFGDYIFYGFADQHNKRLASWFIGDLCVFRGWLHTNPRPLAYCNGISNGDGTEFMPFKLADMPEDFVVALSRDRRKGVTA